MADYTPYDYGFRPWSTVIKEGGEAVRGGIDSAFAGIRHANERNAADAKENRALHPLAQKYFAKVADGSMTPAEAAVAAHGEIDANNNGIPDSQEAPTIIGSDPSMSAPDNQEFPDADARTVQVPMGPMDNKNPGLMEISKSQLAPRPPAPEPMEPLRNRDLPALDMMTKDKNASRQRQANTLNDDQFKEREGIKTTNKIKIDDNALTKKGANAGNLQTQKDAAHGLRQALDLQNRMAMLNKKLAAMNAALDKRLAATASSDRMAIARINAAKSIVVAKYGVLGRIRSSLSQIAGDEDAVGTADKIEQELMGAESGLESGEVPTSPSPETPDIPMNVPAPKMQTGKTEGYKMKFPDGSVHTVPKDKIQAAKDRGGVPTK